MRSKPVVRLVGMVIVSMCLAVGGFGGGHGGGHGGGGHGGYRGGYVWHGGLGWGVYPWFPLSYWPYYYDYPPTYYYAPAPVVDSAQPEVVYSSPTVNYESKRPAQPPADSSSSQPAQTPAPVPNVQNQPAQPNNQKLSMTVTDIKTLAKAGLSDEVILSHIRNNHAVFHLTTEEILDLKNNKVSQQVIDFMINTASQR